MSSSKENEMEYKLVGFGHNGSVRLFSFLAITADRTQTMMTVSADLSLARQFGVKVQELPMLCKLVLKQRPDETCSQPVSITADNMRLYSEHQAAAHGEHRKGSKARGSSAAPSADLLTSDADPSAAANPLRVSLLNN